MSNDLDNLRGSYRNKQNELTACYNDLGILNEKLVRIAKLKNDFSNYKKELIEFKIDLDVTAKKEYENWVGDLLNNYKVIVKVDLIDFQLQNYIDKVDYNLDRLNDEKMRIENEIYSTEGIIGGIKATLNWLATKIENFFN